MAYDVEQVKTVYDELTTKIKTDLDEQFMNGRLKGSDYANVYASLMNTCIQLSFEAPLKEAQVTLIKEQQLTEQEKRKQIEYELTEILPAKKNEIEENIKTLQRQRQGFDDNFKFKIFDSQINAWGIMYSSGMLTDKPSIVSNDEVSFIYNEIQDSLNLSKGFDFINIGYGDLKNDTTINIKKDVGIAHFAIPINYDEYSFNIVPSFTNVPNSTEIAFWYNISKRDDYTSNFSIDLNSYSGLDVGDNVIVPEIVILYKKDGIQREKKITNITIKIV